MNEDFVPFELAIKLREKGFRENCIGYYDYAGEFHYNCESVISNREIYFCHNKYDNIWHSDLADAPTISQVLKWLRNANKVYVSILPFVTHSTINKVAFYYLIEYNSTGETMESIEQSTYCAEWKDSALAGIEYVLDNLI